MNTDPIVVQNYTLPDWDFDKSLKSWIDGAQAIIDKEWADNKYTHSLPPVLQPRAGSRFVIVTRHDRSLAGVVSQHGSAFAFIDMKGGMIKKFMHKVGDVLKPADWRMPSPHARGNIFDENNGLKGLRWTGPYYLRS